jgi:tight adherence protein B
MTVSPLEILLAIGVMAVTLLAIMTVRVGAERRRAARERRLGVNQESSVILRRGQPTGDGVNDRIDAGFVRLVARTGIETTPDQMLALMCLLGVLVAGALYLWRGSLGLTLLGLAIGILIPLSVLWILKGRYQNRIQQLLPDALYLIARSLRAGMSLEQAVELVGEEGPRPISTEFKRASASIQLGLSIPTSLQLMADRLELLDFNAFVSTVSYHQATGGNLPLILDRLASGARDRNQFRGAFFAATAQGRITAIALAAAGPLLILGYLLFQPAHTQGFLNSPQGWVIMAVVAVVELIGVVWISRILRVDY